MNNPRYTCDPSMISANELPIMDRMLTGNLHSAIPSEYHDRLWQLSCGTASELCAYMVCHHLVQYLPEADQKAVRGVIIGRPWPVPKTVYTRADWARDRSLRPVPGQEIEEEIYEDIYNSLPPLSLPRCDRTESYVSGFMSSEPHCIDPVGPGQLYQSFGKRDGRFYYIGLLPKRYKN